jgi:hypothetical protein
MVCTGNYVATNTRKTKEGCKKFSRKQAVTQSRPTKKSLCMQDVTHQPAQDR